MKKRLFGLWPSLFILVLVAGALWHRYPDLATLLNASPQLDGSTPASQNGLELLGIRKTERNAYTLILNAPSLPKGTEDSQNPYSPRNAFALEATSSQGQHWKMGWRVDSSQNSFYNGYDIPLHRSGFPDPMLLAELPLAYPPGCQWVDVEMTGQSGQHARWRLTRLQTAQNTVPVTPAPSNTYARNGVFLRLDGQWRHWDSRSHQEWRGEVNLSGCTSPDPTRKWRVQPTGGHLQWISFHERNGPSLESERGGTMTITLHQKAGASLAKTRPLMGVQMDGFYPGANHYGVLYFDLLEYQVGAKETLISRTPLALTAPLPDKGSQEKLYPKSPKSTKKATPRKH